MTTYTSYGLLAETEIIVQSGITNVLGNVGSGQAIQNLASLNVYGDVNIETVISTVLAAAVNDYNLYNSETPTMTNSSTEIGETVFTPGVIELTASNITISDNITLNGNGNYIFLVPNGDISTVTTNNSVNVNLVNDANSTDVYWILGGSLNLTSTGENITQWVGNIISAKNVVFGTGSINIGSVVTPFSGGTITVNENSIISTEKQAPKESTGSNYINFVSTLADGNAIVISTSNSEGGSLITVGGGGINVNTSNDFVMATGGGVNFQSYDSPISFGANGIGIIQIDGVSGVAIGNLTTPTILMGTTANSKNIVIGNLTDTTTVNLQSGTGGINLDTGNGGGISLDATGAGSNFTVTTNADGQDLILALNGNTNSSIIIDSDGTGVDAIRLNSANGGIQIASSSTGTTGDVSVTTAFSGSRSVNISAAPGGTGGIVVEAGSSGISMNAYNGGAIGIGHFNGGEMFIGTAAVARPIILGNVTGSTKIFQRYGDGSNNGGWLTYQGTTASYTTPSTVTVNDLLSRIIEATFTSTGALTLPTASDIISGLSGIQINDSIEFTVVNLSGTGINVSINIGTGGTMIGYAMIHTPTDSAGVNSGSGTFRLRITDTGTPAYILYRIN